MTLLTFDLSAAPQDDGEPSEEEPGGTRWNLEEPGGTRRNQVEPGGTREPPVLVSSPQTKRRRLKRLTLLHLGREYPKGGDYFRDRLRAAFDKNRNERNPEKVKELIARGEFVARELEALYYLRKYRAMKKRYYEE
ncbi:uncharacterized protein V6R79_005081 [Siganus canaliculatus]